LIFSHTLAQNTVAKFKYEDAEKAFYDGNYTNCISLLDETEKLLGKSAPNILHLKIMAQHKLFMANPKESYDRLEQLRNDCNVYLTKYDIAGLEEKYRDVYEIQNDMDRYPKNRQEFSDFEKEAKRIFERYLNARGGKEALNNIKTLYRNGTRERLNSKYDIELKYMSPDKNSEILFVSNKKKKLHSKKVFNGLMGYFESSGDKKKIERKKITPIIPEMDWVNAHNPNYSFDIFLSSCNDNREAISIKVVFKDDVKLEYYEEFHIYDRHTNLLQSIDRFNYKYDEYSKSYTIESGYNLKMNNYEKVGEVIFPHQFIHSYILNNDDGDLAKLKMLKYGNTNMDCKEKQAKINAISSQLRTTSYTDSFSEIYINDHVVESDFE